MLRSVMYKRFSHVIDSLLETANQRRTVGMGPDLEISPEHFVVLVIGLVFQPVVLVE